MTKKDESKTKASQGETQENIPEILPPLDFSSLVLPFFTQALIKLGQIKDPLTDKEEDNINLAKRLIDLLDLLQDRTKNNLKPEEREFLDSCLHQLKMAYMQKAKIIQL